MPIQILTDSTHRMAYATDASAYRELPLGVAYPKDELELVELIHEARRRNTCLIPRERHRGGHEPPLQPHPML